MNQTRTILIIHPVADECITSTHNLADHLKEIGAQVWVRVMDTSYDEMLDAMERADTIVCWR